MAHVIPGVSDIQFKALNRQSLAEILEIERVVQISPWSAGDFITCFDNDFYRITGAYSKDRLLAYAVLMVHPPEAELHTLAIDRPFQNRGIGRIFIRHLVEQSAELAIERIYLEVRESNAAAVRLYENSGFIHTGSRPGYYQNEAGSESALLLRLDLSGSSCPGRTQ